MTNEQLTQALREKQRLERKERYEGLTDKEEAEVSRLKSILTSK